MYKKILLPTDGSDFANNAAKHALFLASKCDAKIIALSVVENDFVNSVSLEENILEITNILKEDSQDNLDEFKNFAASSELDIEYLIKEGNPAKKILEVAKEEDVDLIVVGSSGKTGFDKFIMGSVADKIVSSADCAVLVIH